jgi:hypothetical protein
MAKSSARNCGNVNLKGKKSKTLSCFCCCCIDTRDKINRKIIEKELQYETNSEEVKNMDADAALSEGCNWDYFHYYDLDVLE